MTIELKGIIDVDTVNYRKICMVLEFPKCNFKCDRDCGQRVCQNSALAQASNIKYDVWNIIDNYLHNPLTEAIVCQGLEPFDTLGQLYIFIDAFRQKCDDDIVIYTGYKEEEIYPYVQFLKERYKNIIIKFGRFKPNDTPYYDEVLGVNLASHNQYARKIC